MHSDSRFRKLHYRAWHRGTREADAMIGGFFDAYHAEWNEADIAWFERILAEQDVDIMAWGLRTQEVPAALAGQQMDHFQALDFIDLPKGIK